MMILVASSSKSKSMYNSAEFSRYRSGVNQRPRIAEFWFHSVELRNQAPRDVGCATNLDWAVLVSRDHGVKAAVGSIGVVQTAIEDHELYTLGAFRQYRPKQTVRRYRETT